MTDPRNIAHDKKVQQEKKHQHVEIASGAEHAVQPGRKPQITPKPDAAANDGDGATAPATPSTP